VQVLLAKCLEIDLLTDTTEHLRETEGPEAVSVAGSTESRWKRRHSAGSCRGPRILGTGFWDRASGSAERSVALHGQTGANASDQPVALSLMACYALHKVIGR
jgi:hypothetical protein